MVIYAWAQYDVSKWNPKNVKNIQNRLEQEYNGTFEFIGIEKDKDSNRDLYLFRYKENSELTIEGTTNWSKFPWIPIFYAQSYNSNFSEVLYEYIIQKYSDGEVDITGMNIDDATEKIYDISMKVYQQLQQYYRSSQHLTYNVLEVIDGSIRKEIEFYSSDKSAIRDQLMEIRTK